MMMSVGKSPGKLVTSGYLQPNLRCKVHATESAERK